jgi:hypothetical protein
MSCFSCWLFHLTCGHCLLMVASQVQTVRVATSPFEGWFVWANAAELATKAAEVAKACQVCATQTRSDVKPVWMQSHHHLALCASSVGRRRVVEHWPCPLQEWDCCTADDPEGESMREQGCASRGPS